MKYCRFQLNGQAHYGLVESAGGRDAIMRVLLTPPEAADGDLQSLRTRRIEPIALEEATLLPPVCPSKIVCVGRNYREHAVVRETPVRNIAPEFAAHDVEMADKVVFREYLCPITGYRIDAELARAGEPLLHDVSLGS